MLLRVYSMGVQCVISLTTISFLLVKLQFQVSRTDNTVPGISVDSSCHPPPSRLSSASIPACKTVSWPCISRLFLRVEATAWSAKRQQHDDVLTCFCFLNAGRISFQGPLSPAASTHCCSASIRATFLSLHCPSQPLCLLHPHILCKPSPDTPAYFREHVRATSKADNTHILLSPPHSLLYIKAAQLTDICLLPCLIATTLCLIFSCPALLLFIAFIIIAL